MKKKVSLLLIFIFALFLAPKIANAKLYALYEDDATSSIPAVKDYSYILGTYMFEDTASMNDSNLIKAGRTPYSDDMYMNYFGTYYATFGDDTEDISGLVDHLIDGKYICISHLDGVEIAGDSYCASPESDKGAVFHYGEGVDKTVFFIEGKTVVPPETPSKEGYEFVCWTLNDSEDCYNFDEATPLDAQFYVKYRELVYNVRYDLNGGSGSGMANHTCRYLDFEDNTCKVAEGTPSRTGYNFLGWSATMSNPDENPTDSGNTNGYLLGGDSLSASLYTANGSTITLHAMWAPAVYSITYVLNDGYFLNGAPTSYTYTTVTNLVTPKHDGYTFNGWYTANTGGNSVTSITATDNGNKTFYARWTAKQFTVTYGSNTMRCTVGTSCTAPSGSDSGSNMFKYWNDSNNGRSFETGAEIEPVFDRDGNPSDIGLTPVYTKDQSYNITFNTNGGNLPNNAITSYVYGYGTNLPIPTKANYSFDGWYTANTGGTQVTRISADDNGDKTYYARWTINSHKFTVINIYGSPIATVTEKDHGASVALPSTPSAPNVLVTFAGWYRADTNAQVTGNITMNDDVTIYAKWTTKTIGTITYNLNGGTNPSETITTYVPGVGGNLPTPTKANNEFAGWYENSALTGTAVTSIPTNTSGNKAYYAKWTINNHKFTVVNIYGNPIATVTEKDHGASVALPSTPSAPNVLVTFAGWYRADTNSVVTGNITMNDDVTIYAKWTTKTIGTITYNLDGGTNPSGTITTYVPGVGYNLPTPTKSNYEFDGWYENSALTGTAVTSISTNTSGNKAYYAKWTINNHKFTVVNIYGNPIATVTEKDHGASVALPSTPSAPNVLVTFAGWYRADTNSVVTGNITMNDDVTIYAKWTTKTIGTITYELDGGTNPSGTITKYVPGVGYNLPTPTKSNYEFDGWYENSALTGTAVTSISTNTSGNKTYYAKWTTTGVTYTITYRNNGGTMPEEYITKYVAGVGANLPVPTKSGLTFAGWCVGTSGTCTNPIYILDDEANGPKTLTAKWEE